MCEQSIVERLDIGDSIQYTYQKLKNQMVRQKCNSVYTSPSKISESIGGSENVQTTTKHIQKQYKVGGGYTKEHTMTHTGIALYRYYKERKTSQRTFKPERHVNART